MTSSASRRQTSSKQRDRLPMADMRVRRSTTPGSRQQPGSGWSFASVRRLAGDWLPALPLIVVIVAVLIAPAFVLVVGSFDVGSGELGMASWEAMLNRRGDVASIWTTLALSATVATIATVVGGPLAWILSRMAPVHRATWLALLTVGGNFGGIGLGFAYFTVLGTTGMLTILLQGIGLGIVPPRPSSFEGLVIGYLYTNVPLFVLLTIPAMGALRDEWWEAAQVASATRWQFWWRVGIPVLTPFIGAGWLLIFTWSVGLYGLAYALAGGGAAAGVSVMTLRIGSILTSDITATPRAYALAVLLMAIAIVSLLAYRVAVRRGMRWYR